MIRRIESDIEIVKKLGTSGEKSPAFLFRRQGRILLILAGRGRRTQEGFSLYQPQSLLARVAVKVLTSTTKILGHPPTLEKIDLERGGVIGSLSESGGSQFIAALLGNPEHLGRRIIIWLRDKNGGNQIWKIGLSVEARQLVLEEGQFLMKLQEEDQEGYYLGIPRSPILIDDDFTGLGLPFYQGKGIGRGDELAVAELLLSWLDDSEPLEWRVVASKLENRMGVLPDLSLRSSLRHGDFTSWNVIRTDEGLRVIDWEMGIRNGMPGWDLVHWLVQDARLVRTLGPESVIEEVLGSLREPIFKDYHDAAGWSINLDWLLASYLIFYENDQAFATSELLEVFLRNWKGRSE